MIISPSVLSCDFANLEKEIGSVSNSDYIHIDVMDGHFVPNISVGFPVIRSIKNITDIPLDVHLMISSPSHYIERFVKSGADILSFHLESEDCISENIRKIRDCGAKPMLAISPSTPPESVYPYLEELFGVLVMTVEPGYGGQKLIESCLAKASKIRNECISRDLDIRIEADGGITGENIMSVRDSGVDIAVLGTAVFCEEDRYKYIESIKSV